MEAVCLERHHRRRPNPQVVVQPGGRLAGLAVADVDPLLAGPGFHDQHLADGPLADQGDGVLEDLGAARLGADLHHPAAAPGGLDHAAAFDDVVRAGLFHVHVFAGLAGEDRRRGVPVVGRGDDDRIHRTVVENPTQVGHGPLRGVAILVFRAPILVAPRGMNQHPGLQHPVVAATNGLAFGVGRQRVIARVAGSHSRRPLQFRQRQARLNPVQDHLPHGEPGLGRRIAGRDELAELRGRNEDSLTGMLE